MVFYVLTIHKGAPTHMEKFYSGVVRNRKIILIIFACLFVLCFFLKNLVAVNYDINDYLPPDTHSTVSLDVMEQEFAGGIPNARVMVYDVTVPEALEYKEKIAAVEGVSAVTWLDDAVDITVPLTMQDAGVVESHYKDGAAVYSVTVDEEFWIDAVEDIRQIVGEENAITGTAASTALSTTSTMSEIPMISAMAVLFTLVVLLLTTNSWAEPVLVLVGIGMAVILNSGSNLIFGEISFITNAAGSILQLAVSLDYSVFLIHRFEECRKICRNAEEAMVMALCKSTSSILSSGLTTVIGFLALALMQFRIGPDLGLALAKGIAISLLTVFLFTPSMLLFAYRLMDVTRHRPLLPSFRGLGKMIRAITVPIVIIFAVAMVPSYLASNANSYYYGSSQIFGTDTRYGADTAAIEEKFGISDTYVLMVPKGDTATETRLSNELKDMPEVTGIISFVDMAGAEIPHSYLDEATLALLESDEYTRMVISVSVPTESEETFDLVQKIRQTADSCYPDAYYLAGRGVSTYDLMDTITADMLKVNLAAIGAVFLVLVLTMRRVVMPAILVLCIETAVWLNLAVPYFQDSTIFYIAYLIISSIQLGSTVDYAILMTDRYRENRQTALRKDALVQTVSDVTVSLLTSGSVLVMVGFLMSYISSNRLLAQLGLFIGRGTLFSLAIVFFALPGLLSTFDRFTVDKNSKGNRYLRS